MVSPERHLAGEIIQRIFERREPSILIGEVCNEIVNELFDDQDMKEKVEEALNSLNCGLVDYYDEISERNLLEDLIESRITKDIEARIISRYRFQDDNSRRRLIRTDLLRDSEDKDVYLKMLLNQELIKEHLLSDDQNSKKDSNFEKLCAILLRGKYQCKQVGILRESPAKDGGLDFFGIRQSGLEGSKSEFIFGQAKRRKSIGNKDVNSYLLQWEKGFVPMVQRGPSLIPHYELAAGKPIQEKLVKRVPNLFQCVTRPMMVCVGLIPNTQIKHMEQYPYHAITIFGTQLIQQLCISISQEDPQGFDSWFEAAFPHKFIPDVLDDWLEGQLKTLIIVGKEP